MKHDKEDRPVLLFPFAIRARIIPYIDNRRSDDIGQIKWHKLYPCNRMYLIVMTPQKRGSRILFTGMMSVTSGTDRE